MMALNSGLQPIDECTLFYGAYIITMAEPLWSHMTFTFREIIFDFAFLGETEHIFLATTRKLLSIILSLFFQKWNRLLL
jgi:hypothetical protein